MRAAINNPDANSRLNFTNREVTLLLMAVFVMALGAMFLYFVGQYALVGRHPFLFFADSDTYHDIYSGFRVTPDGVIGVSYNYLGPMLVLSATGGNIYLVMMTNVAIFFLSIMFICRALNLDPVKASLIQFGSPLTASSLLSVNKEIIVFPVIALLIAGYKHRSVTMIVAAIAISILARWQLTVFCIIVIGLYFMRNANRYVVLLILLLSISFAYFAAQSILEPVLENVESSTSVFTEGSGLFERLLDIQNDGFYFLIMPLKAAHLMFSLGFHFDAIMNPINVYNDQVVSLYCLVNLVFLFLLFINRRLVLKSDLFMISLVYLIVFGLTPVYAPRYFYAVTVLWALMLAGARGSIASRPIEVTQSV